jgi:polysaccharide export outer membrane protein
MMFIGLYHKLRLFIVFLIFLNSLFSFLVGCGGKQTVNYQHMDLPPTRDSQSEKLRNLVLQSAMIKNVDPDADYIIGPDDVLDIEVFEVEELKKTVRVSSQGYISLSLAGQIKAKGLTPTLLEQEIARRLDKYLNDPLVSVYVKEYKAQKIGIIGAVDKPQVYIVTGQRYLLDMLSMAGGLSKEAGNICYVLRPVKPDDKTDAKDAPRTETLIISLNELLEEGNLTLNIPVFNGDVINVPKGGVVFVDGAVRNPGAFTMKGKTTLMQAIAMAQGLSPDANPEEVRVYRENGKGERNVMSVNYEAIQEAQKPDLFLAENDVVIVPKEGVKNFFSGFINTIKGLIYFTPIPLF